MLFRMVTGPELEEIWEFIAENGPTLSREVLDSWCTQRSIESVTTTSVDEALLVLKTLRFVSGNEVLSVEPIPGRFKLSVIRQLRQLALGKLAGGHALDPWYLQLLDRLFIGPDVTFLEDLHRPANLLAPPSPLNHEKLNAWRRVMEWLGTGRRASGGFVCRYSPELLAELLSLWESGSGPLEAFLTQHLGQYLPYQTRHSDLPDAIRLPLQWLRRTGAISLDYRQDAPFKAYDLHGRVNWISVRKGA